MRKTILQLHLYTALAFGLFIIVLGATGSLMVFAEEFDRLLNPQLFTAPPGQNTLPVAEIRALLKQNVPGAEAVPLLLPQQLGETYRVQWKGQQYFLNPFHGGVVGVRPDRTIWSRLSQLHTSLMLGQTGAAVVHVSSIVLLWLVISGVYLWLPYRRWRIAVTQTLRRFAFDAHLSIGIFSFLLLGVLAGTGIVLSYEHQVRDTLIAVTKAKLPRRDVKSLAAPGIRPLSADEAIAAAANALPGAKALSVLAPKSPDASYVIGLRFPEDRTPIGRSWVVIDQYRGTPLSSQSSRTAPLPSRTLIWARALHTGDAFGTLSRLVMALASLIVVLQVITGAILWWKKVRTAKRRVPAEV